MSVLITVDPSSTVFGYAAFDMDRHTPRLVQCGLLLPDKGKLPALVRIDQLCIGLGQVIHRYNADGDSVEAVVEIMGTKQYTTKRERRSSLPLCALAMGRAWGVCVAELGYHVHPVDIAWTQGTTKALRQAHAAAEYSTLYDPAQDTGADAADAICLGEYWIERRE